MMGTGCGGTWQLTGRREIESSGTASGELAARAARGRTAPEPGEGGAVVKSTSRADLPRPRARPTLGFISAPGLPITHGSVATGQAAEARGRPGASTGAA